jgi:hypothetical protein
MEPSGWYLDPYGRHERRWISAGHPTALVSDERHETTDPPPPGPMPLPLVETPAVGVGVGSDDLLRADDGSIPVRHHHSWRHRGERREVR